MKARTHFTDLPRVIATYWATANARRIEEASACFSRDAAVHDEGQCHQGTSAIRTWIEETTRKYNPFVEPLRSEEKAGRHFVTARVSGTFPGSPVELDYVFTLRNQHIVNLEIQ
jgi:SnoaL-like protein